MADDNGINVAGLSDFFAREQQEYLLQSAQWCQLRWSEVIGDEFTVCEFDVHTVTVEELKAFSTPFTSVISETGTLNAFGAWFDTDFNGSRADPTPNPVTLTTAPESTTHWAQQVFLLYPPLQVESGDVLEGVVKVARQKLNHRLLWVQITLTLTRPGVGQVGPERTLNFRID
jgi:protein arginine N-methyltransferase 1